MAGGTRLQPPPLLEEAVSSPYLSLRSTNQAYNVSKSNILQTTVSNSRSSNPDVTVSHKFSFGHGLNSSKTALSSCSTKPLEEGEVPPTEHDEAEAPSVSFLEALQSKSIFKSTQIYSEIAFSHKPISLYQGKPSISFNILEKNKLLADLKFMLVGKFTHGRPTMAAIQKFFGGLKLQQKVNISLLDKKHIIIECLCKGDFYHIWLKLNWYIQGFTMRIFKWEADFVPTKESSIAPVWIRLEKLPLYFFDVQTLLSIANVIGSPILIDPKNVNRSDFSSARICVELDVAKPLIDSIWISLVDEDAKILGGFWVSVCYDVVPSFCLACSHIGHGIINCKRLIEDKPSDGLQITVFTVSNVTEKVVLQQKDKVTIENKACNPLAGNVEVTKGQHSGAVSFEGADAAPAANVIPASNAAPTVTAADTVAISDEQQETSRCMTAATLYADAPVASVPAVAISQADLEVSKNAHPKDLRAEATSVIPSTVQRSEELHSLNVQDDKSHPLTTSPCSSKTKQYETQHKLPQVWERVKGQGSVNRQTEMVYVKRKTTENSYAKDKTFPTTNRFIVLSNDPVSELNVPVCSNVHQNGVQDKVSNVAQCITQDELQDTPKKAPTVAAFPAELPSNIVAAVDSSPATIALVSALEMTEEVLPREATTAATVAAEPALSTADMKQTTQASSIAALNNSDAVDQQIPTAAIEQAGIRAKKSKVGVQDKEVTGAQLTTSATGSITETSTSKAADRKETAQIINVATPQERHGRRTEIANVQQGNWVSAVRQNSVTTRAQARKLAPEQHTQQQFEKASVRKAKEQMQNKNLIQSVQMLPQDRNDSEKTIQERIEENYKLHRYSTVEPKRTKDGCPVVVFKKEDINKWIDRQKAREQEQMRAQGLPFDDKG